MHSQVTRRGVILGSLTVLPLGLFSLAPKRVSKMKYGFTSYTWGKNWDIAATIANCTKAKAYGVELRTSMKYAHGVELTLSASQRSEVKRQFADSTVKLVGLACSEKFDHVEPDKLKAAIEAAKGYMKLSHDCGGSGVRVFVNDFQKGVPEERTIAQAARSLNEVGRYAADFGQVVQLENHGSAGRLTTLRQILDQVRQKNVRIKLNCDPRDAEGGKLAANFDLVKGDLDSTLHMHDLNDETFPYQLQVDLLIDAGWKGWWLVEEGRQVPDAVEALINLRERWEAMVEKSLQRVQ